MPAVCAGAASRIDGLVGFYATRREPRLAHMHALISHCKSTRRQLMGSMLFINSLRIDKMRKSDCPLRSRSRSRLCVVSARFSPRLALPALPLPLPCPCPCPCLAFAFAFAFAATTKENKGNRKTVVRKRTMLGALAARKCLSQGVDGEPLRRGRMNGAHVWQ